MKNLNLAALEEYIGDIGSIEDIEDIADNLSASATDLALKTMHDNCVGCLNEKEVQTAVYNIYHISKMLKALISIDSKKAS